MDYTHPRRLAHALAHRLASARLACTLLALAASAVLSGCYNPNIPNGAERCSLDGKCPEGFTCFPDKHCYKPGSNPTCLPACAMPTPLCDKMTLKCVQCLMDKDCPAGTLCVGQSCKPGCSATHPGCAPDAGSCDVDMGQCRGCISDAECGDQSRPRCDKLTGLCVPCLPGDDQCKPGTFCAGADGKYSCVDGCDSNDQCVKLAMMGGDDGGMSREVTCCDHRCVDVSSNSSNCGRCGTTCMNNTSCCNAQCVDQGTDVTNCGGCGTVCTPRNATGPMCTSGACTYDKCTGGFDDCDSNRANGCETGVAADAKNCGKCGMACMAPPNAGVLCMAGNCAIGPCTMGFSDCNRQFMDGCEVSIASDIKNCGACGMVCPALANALPLCVAGKCGLGMCSANFANCNAIPGDGCEINTATDPKNCSKCGMACPAGANQTATCVASVCRPVCNMGFGDCDGNVNNGCEADFSRDVNNCKACGTKCVMPNGVAGCAAATCTLVSCNVGFANCNNMPADGCEINTTNDVKNCGACGRACANGQVCTNSVCAAGLRPDVRVCGASTRMVNQFFPQGQNYNVILNSCVPDANTQALFITRNFANGIGAPALQAYLNGGGVVLTEYNISHTVWNLAFGTVAAQGARLGGCDDTLPSLVQFTANDPFWQANVFKVFPNSGCGHSVSGFPGVIPLAGWDANNAAVGYRDLGNGRLWATDFDWQDNQVYADNYTVNLMGYMMSHRR